MRIRHPSIREDRVQPLVWILLVAVVILGATVAAGGVYLNARRNVLDARQQETRQAICTILNALPPPPKDTPKKERDAFAKAYRLERCVRPPAPKPTPAPKRKLPAPQATAGAQPTPAPVIVRRTSRPITVYPTVTKTRTVKPQPSKPPTHKPTPEPSTTCLLGIRITLTCPK